MVIYLGDAHTNAACAGNIRSCLGVGSVVNKSASRATEHASMRAEACRRVSGWHARISKIWVRNTGAVQFRKGTYRELAVNLNIEAVDRVSHEPCRSQSQQIGLE